MILDTNNNWHSPVRKIIAKVELYEGSTLAASYTQGGALKSFNVERVGEESKFFGFGVCQKTNIHLVDKDRVFNITTANSFKNYIGTTIGRQVITSFPTFYVSEVHRDENTNELSITAYDKLYAAAAHTVAELSLMTPYTIKGVADACAALLGTGAVQIIGVAEENSPFDNEYPEGANFDGTESIREALNAIAEATQTVYYIDANENLVFKRLDVNGAAALTISKEDYIELSSKTNRRLSAICNATELGDNVTASLEVAGTTQYVRDNPFWDIQENAGELVDNALAAIGGLTINQFECSWRGNAALEVGDKIALIAKDDSIVTSFMLNDIFSYDGALLQTTAWHYEDSAENESNPSTLGEALKQTFARVDKVNQTVEIVAAETAALKMDAENVNITITALQEEVDNKADIADIAVTEVTTTTGFQFNKDGLKITKTDSEISTTITQDGMTISKEDEEVLVANNKGVKAIDLHATTYLIIGDNSRIEDYADGSRTGCFWIGE